MMASRASLGLALLALIVCAQAGRPTNKWSREAEIEAGLVKAYNGARFPLAPHPNVQTIGGTVPVVLLETNIDIAGVAAAVQTNAIEALLTQYSERERFGPYVALGGLRQFGAASIAPLSTNPTTPFFGLNTFGLVAASGPLADLVKAALAGNYPTEAQLKSVSLGGVLACIADVEQDTRVFAANIPLDILVGAVGGDIQDMGTISAADLESAALLAYTAINELCDQNPSINPATIGVLSQVQSKPAALFVGPVGPNQKVAIPNGYVSVGKLGAKGQQEIEITQLGVEFELERSVDKKTGVLNGWFDLEAEQKKKNNLQGQLYGILSGEVLAPISVAPQPKK